jgi:hypothetical protein
LTFLGPDTLIGNTGIREMKIVSTEKNEDGIPIASVFETLDENGRAWTLASRKFSGVVIPVSKTRKDIVIYENVAEFTLEQTGEKGIGIDEYLVNPYI